jgi:hypothetical protein
MPSISYTLDHRYFVLSECYHQRTSEKVDLAIVRKTGDEFQPRLLIEIKETSSHQLTDVKENRIKRDAEKLLQIRDSIKERGGQAADHLRVIQIMAFFFRNADKTNGISQETDRMI